MSATTYPPDDQTDFHSAGVGHISAMRPCVIYSDTDASQVVWDNEAYNFLKDDLPEDLVNKSLLRQSRLCHKQGLFRVKEGIYQVRGLDISNITFVETLKTDGVVVIDPLTSVECAREAITLYENHRPGKTIKALIYTHSHADHFGGAGAVIEKAGSDLPIYAPDGFLEHAVSENVYAGNAMGRRALYMYGESLPKSPEGQVGSGLGMTTSTGVSGLAAPTVSISETGKKVVVDDLVIIFQVTPGTEAPSEMNFHFPQYKALCMAENATHNLHNIQTLRGALVRDARVWSKYLDESIVLYGADSDVVFASHHWPTFGNDNLIEFLSQQRDLYAYLHNETLRQLNNGLTGLEIAEEFVLPSSLDNLWSSRGYYGSISHNVKAIYNRYMGWFDGNPAHLWEHPPVASALRYVECMGGIEKVIDMGIEYRKNGDLRFASTLLSHAVFADQANKRAKDELSIVFIKLGHGAENATWRNFYLTGAQELVGPITPALNAMTADSLMALGIEQLMDTLAIRINGPEASKDTFTIDVMITDMKSGWHMNLSNSVLTGHTIDYKGPRIPPNKSTSLTIWPTHKELVALVDGESKNLEGIESSGDEKVWNKLTSLLTGYDTGFAIVTPEKKPEDRKT